MNRQIDEQTTVHKDKKIDKQRYVKTNRRTIRTDEQIKEQYIKTDRECYLP